MTGPEENVHMRRGGIILLETVLRAAACTENFPGPDKLYCDTSFPSGAQLKHVVDI